MRLAEKDRATWAHVLAGHANRYQLFLAAAVDHAADAGTVAALIPAGWIGGKYFQLLRKHLASKAPLRQVSYIADRSGVFSTGVLQETVLAVFRRGEAGDVACEQVTMNGTVKSAAIGHGTIPTDTSLPWLLPRSQDDNALVAAAGGMTKRLKDYHWKVSTGPLVWNRHKDQLSAEPRRRSVKIVWAADLDGGKLHQDPLRDKMRWVEMRHDADERTLVLRQPAVLVQRTTAPEQNRRLVATALDAAELEQWGGRVSVENHVNVLRCGTEDSVLTPRLLTALLDSAAVDRLYRCLTGSVAVSAYELSALPLPDAELLRRWAKLDPAVLPAEIDRVYGLVRDAEQPEPGTSSPS
nr:hypothetical protein GCM10020092_083350 [Actinoplanes digitatis]